MNPLGVTKPDPIGDALGTGFRRFCSSSLGISGLYKEHEHGLELLAIVSDNPGHGQFREFIGRCKLKYLTIWVWAVSNPILPEVLARYGFRPTERRERGELIQGFRWDK